MQSRGRFRFARMGVALAALVASAAGCRPAPKGPYHDPGNDSYEPDPPEPEPETEVITQAAPPPPISGGTMLVTRSSGLAVLADPDRDRIWVVAPAYVGGAAGKVAAEIALQPGDEPGRVVEDSAGLV